MLSIRLPLELENKLESLSQRTHRAKSFYVKEALQRYLEDMEDVFVSLDRITSHERKLYSSEELLAKLTRKKNV